MCLFCRHFDRSVDLPACAAFPDGIPDGIMRSRVDHRRPVAGDSGTRFEPFDAAMTRELNERFDTVLAAVTAA